MIAAPRSTWVAAIIRALEIANDADLRIRAPKTRFGPDVTFDPKLSVSRKVSSASDPRLPPPGTYLEREYKGRRVIAKVLVDGFEFDGEIYRELSARVRRAGWSESARRIFGWLDSEEEFVPLVMLTGTRGSAARKGLVEQLPIGDLVNVHPAPVGERTAARPAGLPRQRFDDAVVLTVVVRFDDPVFIAVTEPQQSGLFDCGTQQMVELRIGLRHGNTPADQFAHRVPTYFCEL